MPLRVFENGRQASLDMTRRPSHAFMPPKQSTDSVPPVTAASQVPPRIRWKAWPMAWFDDEQAVETEKAGPCSPCAIEIWLTGAFDISRGMMNGCTRFFIS